MSIQLVSAFYVKMFDTVVVGRYKANPNLRESLEYADDAGIPFVVVLGESERQEVTLVPFLIPFLATLNGSECIAAQKPM